MKVLLLNGSSNKNGCTFTALSEAAKTLNQEGIETEIFQLGNPEIRDCCGCQACRKLGKCVFEDGLVNEFIEKARSRRFYFRNSCLLCPSNRQNFIIFRQSFLCR